MNIHETNEHSLTVVLPVDDIRRHLTALRVKHGADTPIGHRCSNIMELIQNANAMAEGETRDRCISYIGRQVADLQRLLGS